MSAKVYGSPTSERKGEIVADETLTNSKNQQYISTNPSILSEVNYLFQLKNSLLREKYRYFNAEQESPISSCILSITLVGVFILMTGIYVRDVRNPDNTDQRLCIVSLLSMLSIFVLIIIGGLHVHYHHLFVNAQKKEAFRKGEVDDVEAGKSSTFDNNLECSRYPGEALLYLQRKAMLSTLYCILVQIFEVCFVTRRAMGPMCQYSDAGNSAPNDPIHPVFGTFMNYYYCGVTHGQQEEQGSVITADCILILLLGPITMASVFSSIDVRLLWIQTFLCMLIFALVMSLKGLIPPLDTFVLWMIGTVFLIIDLQMSRIKSFLLFLRLNDLIAENDRLAKEYHSTEMRFLIANMAHDLKTPLMSFTTAIDLIANYTDDAQQEHQLSKSRHVNGATTMSTYLDHVRTCVQSLREANNFMLMTINRCIDYAKASKGVRLVPRLETIDIKEALQMPLNCMRSVQNRIDICLMDLPDSICSHVITDKQWLQENLLCLLSNAVKYSTSGDVTISVQLTDAKDVSVGRPMIHRNSGGVDVTSSVSFDEDTAIIPIQPHSNQPQLRFEVEDHGIGVSDDSVNILFKPFKQAQRLTGGTGLGLYSLAKRLDALGGDYGVSRRRDGLSGSLFWFSIPYRPDSISAADAIVIAESAPPLLDTNATITAESSNHLPSVNKPALSINTSVVPYTPPAAGGVPRTPHTKAIGTLNILLVDDALSIIKMTSMMLRKLGHSITTAENGEVAVKAVETQWKEHGKSFDLILMDLQMPVMDGLEATKRIRKMESLMLSNDASDQIRYDKHFIVGISANSDPETESNAISYGADAFIAKPFTLDTFKNLVHTRLLQQTSINKA